MTALRTFPWTLLVEDPETAMESLRERGIDHSDSLATGAQLDWIAGTVADAA